MAGVHFAQLYDACQWRFFIMYFLGIIPAHVDKALIAGAAFHETKAKFYLNGGHIKAALDIGYTLIEKSFEKFWSPEDYNYAHDRLGPMFRSWVGDYGDDDLKRYKVIDCEREFRLNVPFTPGYITTQRHDAILFDPAIGKFITGETKTASNSLDFTVNTVRMSEQVAAYVWGGYEVFGRKYGGLMVDVTYWSGKSKNRSLIKNQRSELINKSAHEINQMKVNMSARFNEIDSKAAALKTGMNPEFLFRKNTYYCYSYYRRCPYADICGLCPKDMVNRLGENLKLDTDERNLDSLTYDPYYSGEGPIG